jgi:hypothetical protein
MKELQLVRSVVRVLAVVALVAAASCGGAKSDAPPPQAPPNPSVVADLAAFDKNPNQATWLPVHADIVTQQPNTYEGSVVRTLGSGRVPANIVNDAIVDMGAIDWGGTIKWLRDVNIGARASNPTMTRETAKLTWMMFSLRSSWANDFVDLTRTDLRAPSPYLAAQANLNNVNFAEARLTGSSWVGVSLLNSSFGDAVVDGPLNCTGCSWGSAIVPAALTLQYGRWVAK